MNENEKEESKIILEKADFLKVDLKRKGYLYSLEICMNQCENLNQESFDKLEEIVNNFSQILARDFDPSLNGFRWKTKNGYGHISYLTNTIFEMYDLNNGLLKLLPKVVTAYMPEDGDSTYYCSLSKGFKPNISDLPLDDPFYSYYCLGSSTNDSVEYKFKRK